MFNVFVTLCFFYVFTVPFLIFSPSVLLLLPMNLSLVVHFLSAIVSLVSGHGYVISPPSRSFLCKTRANRDCEFVSYEPQSIEAPKNLLEPVYRSEAYGKVASAGVQRFTKLDEYGEKRWQLFSLRKYFYLTRLKSSSLVDTLNVNIKNYTSSFRTIKPVSCLKFRHQYHPTKSTNRQRFRLCSKAIAWHYTIRHRTTSYDTYISTSKFRYDKPLTSSMFKKIASIRTPVTLDNYSLCINIDDVWFRGSPVNKIGAFVFVWNIADTKNAFYQIVDFYNDATSLADFCES